MPNSDLYADLIQPWPSGDGVTIQDMKMSGDANFKSNKGVNCLDPTADQDVATKKYVDDTAGPVGSHAGTHFFGSGDSIALNNLKPSGDVDMDSNKIINLTDPTDPQDAATRQYVLDNAGGTPDAHADTHYFEASDALDLAQLKPSGDVDIRGYNIINSDMPSASGDLANKQYVDNISHTPDAHASSHFDGGSDEIDLAQLKPSGDVDMSNFKIENLVTPVASGDGANKKYVDDNAGGDMDYADARFKISQFSRDLTSASGNQTISGVGFQPKIVIFLALRDDTSEMSVGVSDGSANWAVYDKHTIGADTWGYTGSCIVLLEGSGVFYNGTITMNSDGYVIAWTKGGSKAGTGQIIGVALR